MTHQVELFDLTRSTARAEYADLLNKPGVRLKEKSDFFAVMGGGPDTPAEPILLTKVEYDDGGDALLTALNYQPPVV
jgi:hypothetical protein